jgi:hypothetical protein
MTSLRLTGILSLRQLQLKLQLQLRERAFTALHLHYRTIDRPNDILPLTTIAPTTSRNTTSSRTVPPSTPQLHPSTGWHPSPTPSNEPRECLVSTTCFHRSHEEETGLVLAGLSSLLFALKALQMG